MKNLSDKPPATLDPTRSILSLNYILQTNDSPESAQFNPLAPPKTAESNKFSILGRLSPPITPQNCLIFYTVASSLKMRVLEQLLLEYINQYLLTPTSSCAIYLESSKFAIPELRDHALEIISQNFGKIYIDEQQKKYLLRLNFEYFKNLISRNDLWVDSEDKILDLVIAYMKEREPLQRRLEDIKGDEERDA